MQKPDEPIVVEQTFDSYIGTVWDAIKKVEQMRQWYFKNIPSFRPEVGFETQFNVQSEERDFLHRWKVTEVVSQKKIVYNFN